MPTQGFASLSHIHDLTDQYRAAERELSVYMQCHADAGAAAAAYHAKGHYDEALYIALMEAQARADRAKAAFVSATYTFMMLAYPHDERCVVCLVELPAGVLRRYRPGPVGRMTRCITCADRDRTAI